MKKHINVIVSRNIFCLNCYLYHYQLQAPHQHIIVLLVMIVLKHQEKVYHLVFLVDKRCSQDCLLMMSDLPKYQNNETTRIIENTVPFSILWISGFPLILTAVEIIVLITFANYSKDTLELKIILLCCGIYSCLILLHIVYLIIINIGIVYFSNVPDNPWYNLGADCFNKHVNDFISIIRGLSIGVVQLFLIKHLLVVPIIFAFCVVFVGYIFIEEG